MADVVDLPPIRVDTIDDVRARLDASANLGVATSDRAYVDTFTGSVFYDLTQPAVLEITRLWDFAATEMLAAALLPYSYGDYLDAWGVALNLPRKDEVAAVGSVIFTAPNGTLIGANNEVAVAQTDPDADPIIFSTTEATPVGGIAALSTPTGVTATAAVGGGSLAAAAYHYRVSARVGSLETLAAADVTTTLSGTGRIDLAWAAVPGASSYRVYRSATTTGHTLIADDLTSAQYSDSGALTPDGVTVVPASNTTGGAWALDVQAQTAGPEGNVAPATIVLLLSGIPAVTAVTNPYKMLGGLDVEEDDAYRGRLLIEFRAPTGAGTVADYQRWCLAHASVGFVTVEPLWNGAGTVRCTITDPNNDPVPPSVVSEVQSDLDPTPGLGAGRAPIGAIVTVITPTTVTSAIVAALSLAPGYSYDGTAGTIAIRSLIQAALSAYIDQLPPGGDIIYKHVESVFFTIPGVLDVTSLTVSAGTSNVAIANNQVAALGTVTLS